MSQSEGADRLDALPSVPADVHASVRRLGRGSTANFIGSIVSAIANLGVAVAITRGMSRQDAGVFFSTTSLFMLAVALGQLGTSTGLVYFLSRARALGRPELIRPYLRAASRPVFVVAILAAVGLFVFASPIAEVTNHDHAKTAADFLRALALFLPFASMKTLSLAASRGMGSMRPTVVMEQIVRPLVQFALVVAAVLIGTRWTFPYAWAACFLVGAAGSRGLLRKYLDNAGTGTRAPEPVAKEFWKFTAPRSLANVIASAMQRFDIVLVGAITGSPAAAVYAASTRFLVLGQLGARAISTAAQPRLAESLIRGDRNEVNRIYQTSTAWLMMLTWPLYLLFGTVGRPVLSVFGKGYNSGGVVLLVLSVGMLIGNGCGMVDIVLNMAGRTSWNLMQVILAFGINIGLDLWLIPIHGIAGAAFGWAVAIVVQNVFSLIQVALFRGYHPLGSATTCIAVLSMVCYGVFPLLVRLVLGQTAVCAIVSLLVGSVMYAGLLWRYQDLLQVRALLQVRRTRGTSEVRSNSTSGS